MGQQHPCLGAPLLADGLAAWRGGFQGPVTEKKSSHGRSSSLGLVWGVSCMQGWRERMEDAHLAIPHLKGWKDTAVFGVMDGHGGEHVARFCEQRLPEELARQPSGNVVGALRAAFQQMDELLCDPRTLTELKALAPASKAPLVHPDFIGCTAIVCLVKPEAVVVANAGDCRAVLCRGGKAVDMSEDHKPNNPSEFARIRRAGGTVMEQPCPHGSLYRVNGDLSLSRAIGDLRYKKDQRRPPQEQQVCCTPDVRTFKRQPGDEFMVIACDGVWDVVSSQQAVDYVRPRLGSLLDGSRPAAVAEGMLDCCLSPDLDRTLGLGGDNMTMMVVAFTGRPGAEAASYEGAGRPFPLPVPESWLGRQLQLAATGEGLHAMGTQLAQQRAPADGVAARL
mmetsp:Transcript_22003/g.63440  ORF Transcript_22003/g.63440 Transcript_22003/m.63440 type:complete len:393 (+) Transcript_22003:87-1265(+)